MPGMLHIFRLADFRDKCARLITEHQLVLSGCNHFRRNRLTHWVDYLPTRDDIDHNRIAYYGISWGSEIAPIMLAMEKRFKAAVLVAGGFERTNELPEVDSINFAPRVTVDRYLGPVE